MFWHVICFKNDILFSAQYVLRLIFIDALIKFKIFFLIIGMFMLIFKIETS